MLCTGCLIGEDAANQALQADINADPTTRLTAATIFQDASGWFGKALSACASQPAESDPLQAESAHDQLIEVEDGGLEGGQEGGLVPGEQQGSGVSQLSSVIVKGEHNASQQLPAPSQDSRAQNSASEMQQAASTAIFGSEIAGNDTSSDSPVMMTESSNTGQEPAAGSVPQIASVTEDTDMDDVNQLQLTVYPDDQTASHDARATSPGGTQRVGVAGTQGSFIVLCRENGWLQLYALPDMELVFSYQHANDGPPVMGDGGSSPDPRGLEGGPALQTVEVCMQSFGPTTTSGLFTCTATFSGSQNTMHF